MLLFYQRNLSNNNSFASNTTRPSYNKYTLVSIILNYYYIVIFEPTDFVKKILKFNHLSRQLEPINSLYINVLK